jgi:hypothetical protein
MRRARVNHLIFEQKLLPKVLPGKCGLEPESDGKLRQCSVAILFFG